MKQLLIAIIILLSIVIIFQTCWYKKHGYDTGNVKPPKTFCEDSICFGNDGSALEGLISYRLAKEMADDYGDDYGKMWAYNNDQKTELPDAKTIWFDLKKIKNFIGYIESYLCRAGCVKTDQYGIRVYYAKYPADTSRWADYHELDSVDRKFANRHTLFLVPTYWDSVEHKNKDFDPMKVLSDCQFKPFDSLSQSTVYGALPKAGQSGSEQNHGSLMPPPASGGTYPQN